MFRWIWLVLAGIMVLNHATNGSCSGLIYKNYIVRYDRGWDILCEPYIVRENDSVLKIFHQKGEISRKDYRDFLDIFRRLNPQIRNVDLIRPGQGIVIPLRKQEHGSLHVPASGVVTIPFVTLHDVTEIIRQYSNLHTVRKGDMVSRLISLEYGRYGSESYREGIQLFAAANPDVKNLELIYVGQKLNIPDPAIKENPWYDSLFDDQGHLKEAVNQIQPHLPKKNNPGAEDQLKLAIAPEVKKNAGNLMLAAQCVGGRLNARGIYHLPRQGADEFKLDLLKHPMLEFDRDPKLVFTPDDMIMDLEKNWFQTQWPGMRPVTVSQGASTEQYTAAIFDALEDDHERAEELIIKKRGVRMTVRAKYIRTENEGRRLCITPIAKAAQQTPASIRRYLEQSGILIKELITGGTAGCSHHPVPNSSKIKEIVSITATSQKDFVHDLARRLGFPYVPNTNITFPYAGIQVEAYAHLISTKNGKETLIDFGDLYGNAVTAIRKAGLNVVQIRPEDSFGLVAQKILTALSIRYEQHPTFLAAKRSPQYNTAITIMGILFKIDDNRQVLLTSADLHSAVTGMLTDRAVNVIAW